MKIILTAAAVALVCCWWLTATGRENTLATTRARLAAAQERLDTSWQPKFPDGSADAGLWVCGTRGAEHVCIDLQSVFGGRPAEEATPEGTIRL